MITSDKKKEIDEFYYTKIKECLCDYHVFSIKTALPARKIAEKIATRLPKNLKPRSKDEFDHYYRIVRATLQKFDPDYKYCFSQMPRELLITRKETKRGKRYNLYTFL